MWLTRFLLCALLCFHRLFVADARSDVYSEELVIKRLPSQNMAAHFRFTTTSAELGVHYDLFPRVIGEFVTTYNLSELHLSLTQGIWRTDYWGFAPQPSSPSGAQVYAWFDGDSSSVDERWANLVHSLSGFFCTSLLQIVPGLTARPQLSFRPAGAVSTGIVDFSMGRYAALSSEPVCTENLTPWKKLLPCKEAGISSLLHPIKFYEAQYHSLSVDVIQLCPNGASTCARPNWQVSQNLLVVTDLPLGSKVLNWNLRSLFDGEIYKKCDLAKSSHILAEVDDQLNPEYSHTPDATLKFRDGRKFVSFDVSKTKLPLNVGAKYKDRLKVKSPNPPSISIHSYIGGSGQQDGQIVTRLVNRDEANHRAVYTHVIPWFLRVYYHTIEMDCEGGNSNAIGEGVIQTKKFTPAKDRGAPYLLELDVNLPAQSTCHLSIDFDKSFLRWTEYPPDANKGFFVPPPSLVFRPTDWSNVTVLGGQRTTTMEELNGAVTSPLVVMYGEALLVSLPTPDFSMPYNVICLVCTVIALCFGPIHSLTTKCLLLKFEDKDAPQTLLGKLKAKLMKIVDKVRRKGKAVESADVKKKDEVSKKTD